MFLLASSVIGFTNLCAAQQVDAKLFSDLRWRMVGPFRGGRSLTAVGVAGQPNLFYFGSVGGGVWKSEDAGLTWEPIFDSQPIASIGALAVAPSDPKVIYAGSGEADMRSDITYGNGVYKSSDAGKTWTHIGLEDTRQIGRILVDPNNPDLVLVAALGHAYAANPQRGVFRSSDGGKTWQRVLHPNDDTGAVDLAFDPTDARVIYASLWQTRRPPWNVYPPSNGPGSGLYKSGDGGSTWQRLEGLPQNGLGRIGVAVAPSDPNRVYAIVDARDGGLFRSDDAGKTWTRSDNESRIWLRGWYFGAVTVDPRNADIVYVPNVSVYKSVDGGKSFTAFKGAPGGDDYHSLWISPEDPARMVLSSDQGAVVSLNGGKTWSSWYNQPTGQFYHVNTDRRFPYWLYGSQQDSGSMAVPSRSNYASLSERDWKPIGTGGESDYVVPSPLNADVLFGARVTRYEQESGQEQDISPSMGREENFREEWTLPLAISGADPRKVYFAHQMVFRTRDEGRSWEQISPDLTRESPGVPPNLDSVTAGYGLASPRKGVVYALAPSSLDANLIWAGTDDGLIQVSSDDGAHWTNVTPAGLTAWSKAGIIEASRFDKHTAYVAIDRHRLDDLKPYIYRTHDGGKSWQALGAGIPEGAFVNVVREDSVRRGLLYAGTELGMYVSIDDGEHWQRLQLNLPVVSIRDIVVQGDDLVVATHGRAFWILDDIAPLREVSKEQTAQTAFLFTPQAAIRVRPGSDQGTPLPAEIPKAENPPSGAVLDYYLKDEAKRVTLEILDRKGGVVRRYSSSDKLPVIEEKALKVTLDWVKAPKALLNSAGMHRFVWDLRYASPLGAEAIWAGRGHGPWALPGAYTVRLTVDGQVHVKPLVVKMDPRVKASAADLQAQFDLARSVASSLQETASSARQAASVQEQLEGAALRSKDNPALGREIEAFGRRLAQVLGPVPPGFGLPVTLIDSDRSSLRHLVNALTALEAAVESADAAPTREQQQAWQRESPVCRRALEEWRGLKPDLEKLNQQLRQAGLAEIGAGAATKQPDVNDD